MPWNKDGTRKKSVLYKKQKFGEAISPFKMQGFSGFGNSPLKDGTEHDHPHDRLKDEEGNEIPASGLEGAVIADGKATFPKPEPK